MWNLFFSASNETLYVNYNTIKQEQNQPESRNQCSYMRVFTVLYVSLPSLFWKRGSQALLSLFRFSFQLKRKFKCIKNGCNMLIGGDKWTDLHVNSKRLVLPLIGVFTLAPSRSQCEKQIQEFEASETCVVNICAVQHLDNGFHWDIYWLNHL